MTGLSLQGPARLQGLRILFSANVDWFFLSHRLPLAVAAAQEGAEVWVVAGDTGRREEIEAAGLRFVAVPISRGGTALLGEARYMAALARVYWRLKPDLIHQVTIKPILYGSLIARVVRRAAIVNAISGLGYAFSDEVEGHWLAKLSNVLYRVALGRCRTRTIFQNEEDRERFVKQGFVGLSESVLIRGSGVDLAKFVPFPEPDGVPIVLFASRLLREKGIEVFVSAARVLLSTVADARFVVVGMPDPSNPSSIDPAVVKEWVDEGVVEWWGHREDMANVMRMASVVVLPTWYNEGVPKVLLEAAACGRPIVTTDRPGCRDIVRHGVNGLLVEERRSDVVADAIRTLLGSETLRRRYGEAGRTRVEREFALALIVSQTLAIYEELLKPADTEEAKGKCG